MQPDDKKTLLQLVRHAEQTTMREVDPPLSAIGQAQAERLAARLGPFKIGSIHTSPMIRAKQTAAPLARLTGLTPSVHPDLEEVRSSPAEFNRLFAGAPAPKAEAEAEAQDDYIATMMKSVRVFPTWTWGAPLTTEGRPQLRARVAANLERIVAESDPGFVVCIAHGGTINAALGKWLGVEQDMWFIPWHTGISVALYENGVWTVLAVNDTSHLVTGEDVLGTLAVGLQ